MYVAWLDEFSMEKQYGANLSVNERGGETEARQLTEAGED